MYLLCTKSTPYFTHILCGLNYSYSQANQVTYLHKYFTDENCYIAVLPGRDGTGKSVTSFSAYVRISGLGPIPSALGIPESLAEY